MATEDSEAENPQEMELIRVLLLFQYDHDDQSSLRESIKSFINEFKARVDDASPIAGKYKIELQTLEAACKQKHFDDNVSIYERFLKVNYEFDLAFGLVTEDNRPASKAGNLWLESGLWLGIRGEGSYAGVTHGNVKLPSNMNSWIFKTNATAQEAKGHLDDLANRYIARHAVPDDKKWMRRIKWFLPASENWDLDELIDCEVDGTYALDMASHFSRNGHFTAIAVRMLMMLRNIYEAAGNLLQLGTIDSGRTGGHIFASHIHKEARKFKVLIEKMGCRWPEDASRTFTRFLGECPIDQEGIKELFENLYHFSQFAKPPYSDRYEDSEWITSGYRSGKQVDQNTIQRDVSEIWRVSKEAIDTLDKSLYTQWITLDAARRSSFERTLADRLPGDVRKIGREFRAMYKDRKLANAWDNSLDCDLADVGDV